MEDFRRYLRSCLHWDGYKIYFSYRGPYKLRGILVIDTPELFEEFKEHLFILVCDKDNYVVLKNLDFNKFSLKLKDLVVEFDGLTIDKNTFSALDLKGVFFKNCVINDLSMIKAEIFKFDNCEINVLPDNQFECMDCKINLKGTINGIDLIFYNCQMDNVEEINSNELYIGNCSINNLKQLKGKSINIIGIKNQILTNGTVLGLTHQITILDCENLYLKNINGCVFNDFDINYLQLYKISNTTFLSVKAKVVEIDTVDKVQFTEMDCENITYKNKANYIIGEEAEQSLFNKICYRMSLW